MRSKALGYQITEVPGLKEIRVEESEHSAQGVHIVLSDGSEERSYGIAEAAQLLDALSEAVRLANRFVDELAED